MKHKIFLSVISVFFILILSGCGRHKSVLSFEAMDTFMSVQAYGKRPESALKQAKNRILEIEDKISTTKETSEVYKINQTGYCDSLSLESAELLCVELAVGEDTGWALNPCIYPITKAWGFTAKEYKVPSDQEIEALLPFTDCSKMLFTGNHLKLQEGMAIDFGAVGKGYAGDEAIRILKANGITSALLDLGGNIQVIGAKEDGTAWRVGIKNPWGGEPVAALSIEEMAVVTSGGYERYFTAEDGKAYIHIINSETGRPVDNELVSSTIVCKSGTYADALSTAVFVMGVQKAVDFWNKNRNMDSEFDMILITQDKKLYYSSGLKERLQKIDNSLTFICIEDQE